MRIRKATKKATEVSTQQVIVPRLVKAAELAKREAEQAEAERAREQAAAAERAVKPAIRTPRNAVEARDLFNSLFNEAA